MEVNLIILPKNNNDIHLGIKEQIVNLFKTMFNDVSDNTFSVQNDEKSVLINYLISAEERNMLFLKLSCDLTPVKSAKCLDYTTNKLIKGEHRKKWNIVISYDEVSQLYCCKLMPFFGEFERRTRELVYITIIKIFGVEWFDNSFSKSLQDTLKGKARGDKTKLVEGALNELTYEELKEYLFTPYSNRNFEEVIEHDLSRENIDNLSKEDLVDVINKCRSESLWNRFFSKYKQFENFKEKIEELQPYRNSVMHHKRMTLREYEKVKKSLKKVNTLLVEAIEVLENEIYTETKFVDVVSAFGSLLVKVLGESIPNWVEKMKPSLSSLGELVVRSALSQINITNAIPSIDIGYKMSDQIVNISKQFQMMSSVASRFDEMSNAYKLNLPELSSLNTISNSLNIAGTQFAAEMRKQSQLLSSVSRFQTLADNSTIEIARALEEQAQIFKNYSEQDDTTEDTQESEDDGEEE